MYRNFMSLFVALLLVVLAAQAQAALVTYLPMDEGSGTAVGNSGTGGATYNGTFGSFHYYYSGGEQATTGQGPNPTWTTGKFGSAVQFAGSSTQNAYSGGGQTFWADAIGNYVSVPSGGGLSGTSTASMWVKWSTGTQPLLLSADSHHTNQYGVVLGQGNSNNVIGLNYNGNPTTATGLRYGQWQWGPRTPPTDAADHGNGYGIGSTSPGTDWVNVVVAYGGGNASIYMNGAFLRTVPGAGNSNTLTIGALLDYRPGAAYIMGGSNSTVDDFGVFSATLIAGKMKAIYNTTLVSGLSGYTLDKMNTLFGVYDTGTSAAIGPLTWSKQTAGWPGSHADGDAWLGGDGKYYVQYAAGAGVSTPEPGTLALLGAGLVGLLCYAWRKRK